MVHKFFYYCFAFGFILALILGAIIFFQKNYQDLKIIFFDVGQGDAILISQGRNQMLIDGGRNGKTTLEKLGKYIPFWDRSIEAVVATHPDQDHIGGLIDVLRSYRIRTVLETSAESESQTFKAWRETVGLEGVENVEAMKDITIKFPDGVEARVLYPFSTIESPNPSSTNQYSIVIKLTTGEDSFLFTGDLPHEQESAIVKENLDVGANVLKVSHHGSKYSTSDEFLTKVDPAEAIISVGKNNSYGHPATEIIERLLQGGIKIYRTDEMGDIQYKCKVKSEKCEVVF